MRKLLILIIVLLAGVAYGQIIDSTKSVVVTQISTEDRKNLDEAGWALKQYTTWHYVGTAGTLTGGVVAGIGVAVKSEAAIYAGLGIGIVGFLIQSFSPGFIAKAGNFLIKIGGQ
jgi:hypothetical protein